MNTMHNQYGQEALSEHANDLPPELLSPLE